MASKTPTALDACQEVAQNARAEGTIVDCSTGLSYGITIWYALTNATAHTGTRFKLQISQAASGDDNWSDYDWRVVGVGTTNLEVITNNPAAAGTTAFTIASTTGYTVGTWVFLEDVSTFANSEWMDLVSLVSNTSLTVQDGSTREHAQNSIMNSVAGMLNFTLPAEAGVRFRIVADNTYDPDGATVGWKSAYTVLTDMAA